MLTDERMEEMWARVAWWKCKLKHAKPEQRPEVVGRMLTELGWYFVHYVQKGSDDAS